VGNEQTPLKLTQPEKLQSRTHLHHKPAIAS